MEVQVWPIERLRPYPKNPRRITDDDVAKLAKSMELHGFRNPIHILPDGEIVVGHRRRLAAMKLQLTRVPVIVHHDMTPDEAQSYRIADNKLGEDTKWDFSFLADELSQVEHHYELSDLGFSPQDVQKIFNLDESPAEATGEIENDLAREPDSICRQGEIWDLGPHQLVIGSGNLSDADKAIENWQRKTKLPAKLDGRTFREVKATRLAEWR